MSLLNGIVRLPFEGYRGAGVADLERFAEVATDPTGGVDPVAAFVVETVQGEGGLNAASSQWLGHSLRSRRSWGTADRR